MILLNYKDNRPIYEQIMERVKELIVKGILSKDEALPSVRSLAMELSINPNTIQRAYQELERQGVIYSIKGKGSFVASMDQLVDRKKSEIMGRLKELTLTAKELGMTQAELIEQIHVSYKGGEKE